MTALFAGAKLPTPYQNRNDRGTGKIKITKIEGSRWKYIVLGMKHTKLTVRLGTPKACQLIMVEVCFKETIDSIEAVS